ncbi:MAG: DNA-directed RNA polymerase subunit K [Candidatus Aenigmarchaeota archaeon]|nr:DNA-directed RNA polymerase subunit K [Candidatus Aenigmarchaeota archaeon]
MSDILTRFERTRLIGARALQIAAGAPPLVKGNTEDPIRLAEMELDSGVLPMTVKKKMPPRMQL